MEQKTVDSRTIVVNEEGQVVAEGYTYKQAAALIGVANLNYLRQAVSQGRIESVGSWTMKHGGEVKRVLLDITSVMTFAANFRKRQNDDAHTYELRMSAEQRDLLVAWWQETFEDGPEIEDVTETRRAYQAKRKAAQEAA